MIYNKYDLLELFENFPIVVVDEITGIFVYSRRDEYGFTLEMLIDDIERYCALTLSYKDIERPLFRNDYRKVESITCVKDKMIIHQDDSSRDIVVYFKPIYGIITEDHLPL